MSKRTMFVILAIGVLGAGRAEAGAFTFEKISNELSLYQNYTNRVATRGQTVQVVAIDRFRLGWWFQTEFTADFNYDYDKPNRWDYYMELGILKQIAGRLSINYQHVKGTFVAEPVHQIGLRWRF